MGDKGRDVQTHPSSPISRPSSGTIEVRVRDVDQLFNTIDPSPFLDRDLDRDAEEYIVSSARELPSDVPLSLVVYLEQSVELHDESRVVGDAIRLHFARRSEMSRRDLRQLLRRGRMSLAIGLLFLAGSVAGGDLIIRLMDARPMATVLRESMLIGGWVAMWRPMEIFLHDWWPLRDERRILDRLSRMTVRVVHARRDRAPSDADRWPTRRATLERKVLDSTGAPNQSAGGGRTAQPHERASW
jgi:hypothetical protein